MTNWPPPQGEPTSPQWAPPQTTPAQSWPPPQGSPAPGWVSQPGPAPQWGAPPVGNQDRALEWIVPINRSGFAIAAGYLGIFGLVLPVLGPFALLFGILAFRDIRRSPGKLGLGRAWFGVIAGGIGTLVLLLFLALFLLQLASRGF